MKIVVTVSLWMMLIIRNQAAKLIQSFATVGSFGMLRVIKNPISRFVCGLSGRLRLL